MSKLFLPVALLMLMLMVVPSSSFVAPLLLTTLRAGSISNPTISNPHATSSSSTPLTPLLAASSTFSKTADDDDTVGRGSAATKIENKQPPLPRELMPITMGVFAQMLGEGIALSSLPLYLTRLGATPLMVGLAISCFSVAQMTFAPILVGLSSRIGRSIVLRICLAGAAASSLLIAFSGSISGVIAGRTLAGVFAACVPVAQSGVTDILSRNQTAIGLSRVSAAAQLGVVVGPAASAIFQESFAKIGVPTDKCLPAVFIVASIFALGVLAQMAVIERQRPLISAMEEVEFEQAEQLENKQSEEEADGQSQMGGVRMAQPILRTITIVMGWTAILSNSIYGLFAPRFMGFQQPQLSATYSMAAIMMVATQVAFPRLVASIGAHRACTLGILAAGTGIGGQSLVRFQPLHSTLYMINRAGAAIADTSTATLVASSSGSKEARSRNLALLTSTRAAARIITPLLSSKMFELSCKSSRFPGALPFVTAACFAMAVAPLPTLLLKAEQKKASSESTFVGL